jgi:phage baseplate assembly protein W
MATLNFSKKKLFRGIDSSAGTPPKWTAYDLDLVKRDVLLHLYTPLGSRVMLPGFGTTIWQKLFEPLTEEILEEIKAEVDNVIRSEPRLQLISSEIFTFNQEQGIRVSITCNFRPFDVVETFFADFVANRNYELQINETQL